MYSRVRRFIICHLTADFALFIQAFILSIVVCAVNFIIVDFKRLIVNTVELARSKLARGLGTRHYMCLLLEIRIVIFDRKCYEVEDKWIKLTRAEFMYLLILSCLQRAFAYVANILYFILLALP